MNYLLTSLITSSAAMPTAAIAHELKTKTVIDPSRPPINISGTAISMVLNFCPVSISTSSRYAENKRKQARDALPTEYPLVLALVTFPTASSLSVISLTALSYPLISTIPPALSAMGPNPLMDSTYTPDENMPMVAMAVAYRPPIGFP